MVGGAFLWLADGSSSLTISINISLGPLECNASIIVHSAYETDWRLLLLRVFVRFLAPIFISSLAALESERNEREQERQRREENAVPPPAREENAAETETEPEPEPAEPAEEPENGAE